MGLLGVAFSFCFGFLFFVFSGFGVWLGLAPRWRAARWGGGRIGVHVLLVCGMRGAVGMDGLACGMAAVGREVRERIMSSDPAGLGVVERRVRARLDAMSVQWWHGVTIVRYAPMWGAVRYRVFAGEWTAEQIVFDGKARELGAVRCRSEHNHRAAWYGVDAFDWSFTAEEALRKLLFTITGRRARIS